MGKKSDNAEILKRIEGVLRLRLDGAQFHDIVQFASDSEWGVSDRQIRNYIARADELLVERQDRSRKKVLARHFVQRQLLFAKSVKAGDYRTALAIPYDDAKLRGFYPEKDVKDLLKLTAAQAARIEELERRSNDAVAGTTRPPASAGE